jgi:hypothetical protein
MLKDGRYLREKTTTTAATFRGQCNIAYILLRTMLRRGNSTCDRDGRGNEKIHDKGYFK